MIDFLHLAGRLKSIPRTGWLQAGIDSPETVADHSYRTTLLSMIMADMQGLDTERALRMSLLHDLAEAETGDLTPTQKREGHRELETEAMERLLSLLPGRTAEMYLRLWEEYSEAESPEAKLVHQADKLEMVLQALEYEEAGAAPEGLESFWEVEAEEGPPSKILGELIKRRKEQRP